jgi:site-specific recombinase XerD
VHNETPTVVQEDAEKVLRELLDQADGERESIAPERAKDLYLDDKKREYRDSTVTAHRSRLGFFVEWCKEQGIDDMTDLTARDLHEYRVWRREGINVVSEKTQMDTLRTFVRWCETIDAVQSGLWKKVKSPTIPEGEDASETVIHIDRAQEILSYLNKYEYATTEHVTWLVLVETGIRMGALRALDIGDYHSEAEKPHLSIVHRPDADTPIKNGVSGERRVGLSSSACEVLDDYLDDQRPAVTDEADREPLLTTSYGRISKSTIRTYIYKWSRPCAVGSECPHGRDPSDCEATNNLDRVARCPSSVTPHPIRRGYITHLLQSGVPVEIVSDRCNVSPAIIDQHYDVRSEEDKMYQRQEILGEVFNETESFD